MAGGAGGRGMKSREPGPTIEFSGDNRRAKPVLHPEQYVRQLLIQRHLGETWDTGEGR